jgi:hypothetical protein
MIAAAQPSAIKRPCQIPFHCGLRPLRPARSETISQTPPTGANSSAELHEHRHRVQGSAARQLAPGVTP